MRFSDILRNLRSVFERKRKNPIQLEQDSNLENNLKFLKVDTKSTPIQMSEDTVNINGSLTVNGTSVSMPSDDVITALNDATEDELVTEYLQSGIESSQFSFKENNFSKTFNETNLTWNSYCLKATSNNAFQNNLELKYDDSNLIGINVLGTGQTNFEVEGAAPNLNLNTGANGDISLNSGDDITIDATDTLTLDSDGTYIMKKDGTEFSAANSAYAGMILGYTDIGLDEATATYNLTTSYVVPTDEWGVTFTAPPSGNVEIFVQFGNVDSGGNGMGDLFAGLSTANATSGYSALEDFHEKEVIDIGVRFRFGSPTCNWTLTGLTAGTSYTYYVGVKSSSTTGTPHIDYGGNASGKSLDFIMKATALPATIST